MSGLIVLVAASIGGWSGWMIGDLFHIVAAYIIGLIGSAAGVFFARKFIHDYMP